MNPSHENRLQAIVKSLRAGAYDQAATTRGERSESSPVRFVTISRQAGAGGKSLGQELAKAVNRLQPGNEQWYSWDGELVERVASDHHIRQESIQALENAGHHWFSELIASLSSSDEAGEFKVFRRVATTIRALADAGNAVIVGRGGVFITAGLPEGLHIRLVAPIESRIKRMAERMHVSPEQAAAKVHEIDHNRNAFYRRYWPHKSLAPETFALTFNTAELSESNMVACLLPFLSASISPALLPESAARWVHTVPACE